MLQQIRERIQGWIASTIIGVIVLTFALWGIESYLGSGGNGNQVAKVNGEIITPNQLQIAYNRLKQNLSPSALSALAANTTAQAALKKDALNQLISQKILADAAFEEGFRITPEQLNSVIMQLPNFQVNGSFSEQRFGEILGLLGYTEQQFLVDVQNTLLADQVQTGITKSAFALPNEVNQEVLLANQKRDIRYAIIPAQQFLSSANIPGEAVQQYYQQHADIFKTPEKVSISYLILSPQQAIQKAQVSPQEIQQYYQDNTDSYKKNGKVIPLAQVKDEISKGLAQQKAQQIFSDQSQKLSELTYTNPDTLTTAANALGLQVENSDYFTRQGGNSDLTKNPAIIAATFSDDVLKNNNNSATISLKDGSVVVLRVKDYHPAAVRPLAEVTPDIQKTLNQKAAEAAAKKFGDSIVSSGNLNQASLHWQTKNSVTRLSNLNPQILQAAFSLPAAVANNTTHVKGISLSNGDYALIELNGVHQDVIANLAQQLRVYQNLLGMNYGKLEYQWYVDSVTKKAKVKIS